MHTYWKKSAMRKGLLMLIGVVLLCTCTPIASMDPKPEDDIERGLGSIFDARGVGYTASPIPQGTVSALLEWSKTHIIWSSP